ncbi:cyclin-Q [Patagioenas fasciata]|uniref:cyclin-Q n=1 Tax=Patagioenas fasciata TaxID=372321 RepID=UPI003A993060
MAARGAGGGGAEARARFRVARFIMEAGVKLGLGSVAVATAGAAFQRFSRAAGPGAPHDPHLVAAAALSLAAKATGAPLRARDLLNVAHRCLFPGQPPPPLDGTFRALRESLGQCELLVLRVLRFRLCTQHPHRYLLQFLLALGRWAPRGGWGRVPGVAWALLRDSAGGALGLPHPPQHVALAALHLAMALCARPAPPGAPPRWWQALSPGLGPAELQELELELLGLYGLDTQLGAAPPPGAGGRTDTGGGTHGQGPPDTGTDGQGPPDTGTHGQGPPDTGTDGQGPPERRVHRRTPPEPGPDRQTDQQSPPE